MLTFNFAVLDCDGNDFADLKDKYYQLEQIADKPKCLICHTIPGKGISLLENDNHWHAAQPSEEQWHQIFAELSTKLQQNGVSLEGAT